MDTPQIPLKARAAVFVDFNKDIEIRDNYPVPQASELAPGQCLIKLEYAGVCHSDLHIHRGDWQTKATLPIIGGHEGVGRVVAIAQGGDEKSEVKIGDRVGVKWIAKACLRCAMCGMGAEPMCPQSRTKITGFTLNGTFADYIVSYVDYVTPIPPEVHSAEAAPILCAGMTVYQALKQSKTKVGNWVAISGAGGGLGHLAVQYATAMGLRVIAIDTGEEKKALALKLGAEKWIDFRESKNVIQDVQAAADRLGPHAAIIAAGDSAPFNQALMYLRPTGTLVALGMPGDSTLSVPIPLLIGKGLTIFGSAVGNRQDAIEALDLVARGKVKCHYQVRQLEEINSVFKDLEEGKIAGRVVLKLT